jgi:hypothetical protein
VFKNGIHGGNFTKGRNDRSFKKVKIILSIRQNETNLLKWQTIQIINNGGGLQTLGGCNVITIDNIHTCPVLRGILF